MSRIKSFDGCTHRPGAIEREPAERVYRRKSWLVLRCTVCRAKCEAAAAGCSVREWLYGRSA